MRDSAPCHTRYIRKDDSDEQKRRARQERDRQGSAGGMTAGSVSNVTNTALTAADAGLSAYVLKLPKVHGAWQTGEYAISRFVGASPKELLRAGKIAKFANGVAYLSIGSNVIAFYSSAVSRNNVGMVQSGTGLGLSALGLASFGGAAYPAIAYGATSLVIKIPFVNRYTVQPLANGMCFVDPGCM